METSPEVHILPKICSSLSLYPNNIFRLAFPDKLTAREQSSTPGVDSIPHVMDNRNHFQNHTGSIFTRFECQLACALHAYVRTRRHRRGHVDHSQPPTLEMLNGILRYARLHMWNEAHRWGTTRNAMPPDVHLNAYCLVRNLRYSPSYRRWYEDVWDRPDYWRPLANQVFGDWVRRNSRLVYEYVLPAFRRVPHGVRGCLLIAYQSENGWYTGAILVKDT